MCCHAMKSPCQERKRVPKPEHLPPGPASGWRGIKVFFKEPARCPAKEDVGVPGAGKIHPRQEHQVRGSVYGGAAQDDNEGLAEIDGEDTEEGHRGPADDIAEGHEKNAGENSCRRLFPEGTQVGLFFQGLPGKFSAGRPAGNDPQYVQPASSKAGDARPSQRNGPVHIVSMAPIKATKKP